MTRSGKSVKVLADVVEVDLTNPYVSLDVMTGKGGQLTTRQSVEGMAKETGAVAGVNGDFLPPEGKACRWERRFPKARLSQARRNSKACTRLG
ncbi:hypothetical protein HMSSN036_58870 [Paenibacillus macerans]|nr:hypothetical protein HMSSN036_58870 [Paenibacillus macerans]